MDAVIFAGEGNGLCFSPLKNTPLWKKVPFRAVIRF
jgi:hypothetical protein